MRYTRMCVMLAVLFLAARTGAGAHLPAQLGCGAASVIALCESLGKPVDKAALASLERDLGGASVSMQQLADAARAVGLTLEGYRASFAELVEMGRPAILHLTGPEHFLVLLSATPEVAQVLDGGRLAIMDRRRLEARFSGSALLAKAATEPAPRIAVAETYRFLSLSKPGEGAAHTFRWVNRGTRPLRVDVDSGSCACTVTEASKGEIAPGGEGWVTIKTTPGPGQTYASATLKTNDPDRPRIPISLQVRVPWGVSVFPETLVLTAAYGEGAQATLRVTTDPEARVGRAHATREGLTVGRIEVATRDEGDGRTTWTVSVAAAPTLPVGLLEDVLTIETTDRARPAITVPVQVRVEGDLVLSPPEASLGLLKRGPEGASASIIIRSLSARSFRVNQVLPSSPTVRARVEAQQRRPGPRLVPPMTVQVLTVEVPTTRAGPLTGYVDLITNVPGQERIRVPISGLVE